MVFIGDLILDGFASLSFLTLAYIGIEKDAWLTVIFTVGLGVLYVFRAISQCIQKIEFQKV